MKIAHVSIYPPKGEKHAETGGVASYTKNLVTSMSVKDSDEIFVVCDKIDDKIDSYVEDDVQVFRSFKKGAGSIFSIVKKIREINPTVVHVQQEINLYGGPVSAWLLQWAALILSFRSRVVITMHGVVDLSKVNKSFVSENNSTLPPLLVRLAFRVIFMPLGYLANNIIVHEQSFKDLLVGQYRQREDKIKVIPHGVEQFETINEIEARNRLGIGSDRKVVLFMGYLTGYKGLDLLIEGFSKFVTDHAEALLLIGAGKHPKLKNNAEYLKEYDRIAAKAGELIPAANYKWVGFVEEHQVSLYYSAADVSAYPYTVSMSSSGPMAIAIGHSKPFIGSDVFRGLVNEDLLFKRDVDSLVTKLEKFFNTPDTFSDVSRQLRHERSWEVCCSNTYKIYEK